MSDKKLDFELESQNVEVDAFLYAINQKYGYDFREYSFIHLKRRLLYLLSTTNSHTISELQGKMLHNKEFFEDIVLPAFSVNVTEMFRDPSFYKTLWELVIPRLTEKPFIKVWHAGCSTGAEVYSIAISLMEAGLYDRTQIYATDFNEKVLDQARKGIMPIDELKNYTKNYQSAGGTQSFSKYYTAEKDIAVINSGLLSNVVFASHNLVSDGVFGEMDLIMCRNVLIYFTKPLQSRVIRLFSESLTPGGFLCLGSKETIRDDDCAEFIMLSADEKIYMKKRQGDQYDV